MLQQMHRGRLAMLKGVGWFLQLDACSLAEQMGTPVQHPLLDKVRQCSADPDQAASFFQLILNPVPHVRRQAVHHPWCADTVSRMFKATKTSFVPDDAPQTYYFLEESGCMQTCCTALLGCCSPKAQDGSDDRSQPKDTHQEQEKPSGSTAHQHSGNGSLSALKSGVFHRCFKSAASKAKCAASKLTPSCFKQPKISGANHPPKSAPAAPAVVIDKQAQAAALGSSDQLAGLIKVANLVQDSAVMNLTALPAVHSAQQPCSVQQETPALISLHEHSNGDAPHIPHLEGGLQGATQGPAPAELPEQALPITEEALPITEEALPISEEALPITEESADR